MLIYCDPNVLRYSVASSSCSCLCHCSWAWQLLVLMLQQPHVDAFWLVCPAVAYSDRMHKWSLLYFYSAWLQLMQQVRFIFVFSSFLLYFVFSIMLSSTTWRTGCQQLENVFIIILFAGAQLKFKCSPSTWRMESARVCVCVDFYFQRMSTLSCLTHSISSAHWKFGQFVKAAGPHTLASVWPQNVVSAKRAKWGFAQLLDFFGRILATMLLMAW